MEEKEMAYYLEDLNRIHELSMEKLGEWRQKYPYSQMVHFLMAKKHQVEGFVDDMSVYHKASFYAVDRAFLQSRMTNSELEMEEEDALANQETSDLQDVDIEETPSLAYEEKAVSEVMKEFDARPSTVEKEEVIAQKPKELDGQLSDFAQWLMGLGGYDTPEANIGTRKKKKKKKKSKLEQKIDSSVVKKNEIVSEALAKILAQQGHNEKAIKMYKQLSLIFPEKSSFFALQIEKLK